MQRGHAETIPQHHPALFRWLFPAFGLLMVLPAPSAHAQHASELTAPAAATESLSSGWHVDLSAEARAPLGVGGRLDIEAPFGLQFHASAAHLPSEITQGLGTVLENLGVVGASAQGFVQELTANGAWNVRLGLGLRLGDGFEIGFGYDWIHLGAQVSAQSLMSLIGQGLPLPITEPAHFSTDMHAFHGRFGYRFLIADHVVIRLQLGWVHVLEASASLDIPDELRQISSRPDELESTVGQALSTFVFTPELGLSLGYRF